MNPFSRFEYKTNPQVDDNIDWTNDRFSQLYQIIQYLYLDVPDTDNTPSTDPIAPAHATTSNHTTHKTTPTTTLAEYIKYILGYADPDFLPPEPLGITDLTERYEKAQKTTTKINLSPIFFQTERMYSEFNTYPPLILSNQLEILQTYAVVTNNAALLTWVMEPQYREPISSTKNIQTSSSSSSSSFFSELSSSKQIAWDRRLYQSQQDCD